MSNQSRRVNLSDRNPILHYLWIILTAILLASCSSTAPTEPDPKNPEPTPEPEESGNPVITNKYTADPAAIVYQDTVYLYAGHDQADPGDGFYDMPEWLVYSSTDMVHWKAYPVPLHAKDFKWASGDAWASEVIQRNGKFYWYVTVTHATIPGKAIGVAVSNTPTGPFSDARGSALITNNMTTAVDISWDDIDPTVFVDDDGQAYLFWGNTQLYYAKLKDNMITLDGPINKIDLPQFTEAPWLHKKNGHYYLSYAYGWPEKTAYAMSNNIEGPYQYRGILSKESRNSNTNHQAIIEYKGKDYFIYHNGAIGGSYRRSVCIDYLYYNEDGTMQQVELTTEGVDPAE